MPDVRALEAEVDKNYIAFLDTLDALNDEHTGQFALLRDRRIEGFYPTSAEAIARGRHAFADGLFSIQEVKAPTVDLGFFSHAVDTRLA